MIFRRSQDHRNFTGVSRILWDDLPYPKQHGCGVCVAYARGHGDFGSHCHGDFYELVLVINGSGINSLEGKDYPIAEGSVFVIHPEQQHGYTHSRSLDLFNICIREEALQRLPPALLAAPGFVALFRVEPDFRHRKGVPSQLVLSGHAIEEVARSVDLLRRVAADPEPLNQLRVNAILTDLLTAISIEYQAPARSSSKRISLNFAKVLSFMEQHYAEAITIEDIARHGGLSVRSLHRACLDYAGVPPKQLLIDLRIDHAKQLLAEQAATVTDAAFSSGFADSNHFSKCFRKRVGCSPREFSQRHRATPTSSPLPHHPPSPPPSSGNAA